MKNSNSNASLLVCSCQKQNKILNRCLGYTDFFYFNDADFVKHFDLILGKVLELTSSKASHHYKSSIPENYYVSQKVNAINSFVKYKKLLSIPNPFQYTRLVNFLQNNFEKIETILNLSGVKNTFFQKDCLCSENNFIDLIKKKYNCSVGFQFLINLNVADFFDSIYTHFVANLIEKWAKIFFVSDPTKLNAFSSFAKELDERVRNCQFNKAKGLIKGVSTSVVFSEIFLELLDFFIDKKLKKAGINFQYVRSGDDYTFFFHSLLAAEEGLGIIQNLLLENKLKLNFFKFKRETIPFNFFNQIQPKNFLSNLAVDKENIALLNEIQSLQNWELSSKTSGALKYFLLLLEKEVLKPDRLFNNQSLNEYLLNRNNFFALFSLKQNSPYLTKYILALFAPNSIKDQQLLLKVKTVIEKEIILDLNQQNAEQEIASQIYFADYFGILINPVVLKTILENWKKVSSLLILIVFFYLSKWVKLQPESTDLSLLWEQKEVFLEQIFRSKNDWLHSMKFFGNPYVMIKNISQTEVWLLLYESIQRNWYQGDFKQVIVNDPFFSFLAEHKISFLSSEQ